MTLGQLLFISIDVLILASHHLILIVQKCEDKKEISKIEIHVIYVADELLNLYAIHQDNAINWCFGPPIPPLQH